MKFEISISIRIKRLKLKYFNKNVFINISRNRINVYSIISNYLNELDLIFLILFFNKFIKSPAI